MLRSMSYANRAVRLIAAGATMALAVPAALRAQDTRPVVVVFTFTNSSIGPSRAEFDGIATGVQDLLITDMASNAKIRLVDRSRISEILNEQNMAKNGQIDPTSAVRVGKILGAQYAITGGFMATGKGQAVLTGRTIDIETTQIANPEKIMGSSDDVLGMIGQLSARLAGTMNLAPKPGRRVGDAGDAHDAHDAGPSKAAPSQSGTPASAKSGDVEHFAKPVSEKSMKVKLDVATMKLYSTALDEVDKKNNGRAAELFKQVLAKYSDFEPAQRQLDKLAH